MKTEVYLQRTLKNGIIRQSNQTGYLSINDLLITGNKWRLENGINVFNYDS